MCLPAKPPHLVRVGPDRDPESPGQPKVRQLERVCPLIDQQVLRRSGVHNDDPAVTVQARDHGTRPSGMSPAPTPSNKARKPAASPPAA